jgi:uncharacterized repeat protein (TIGR01451 family)/fimbrial isopeptide formation D2 family protein
MRLRLYVIMGVMILVLGLLPAAPVFAVPPTANVNAPGGGFVGQPFNFDVVFDNSGLTGYGPYLDVFLPQPGVDGTAAGGPNDGLSLGTLPTFSGTTLNSTTLTCSTPPGSTIHPLTGLATACPPTPANYTGPLPYVWQMIVVELPFPSFTNGQNPVRIDFDNVVLSNFADVGQGLPIYARSGFRYGTDPLGLSPPSIGAFDSDTFTPRLFTINKDYNANNNAPVTGPNFPHRYTLTVDIANGQTISPFTLTDLLPNNIAFLSIISITPAGGVVTQLPTVGVAANPPNNDLVVMWPSLTGGPGGNDARVIFEFFVPNVDANGNPTINPNTCADTTSTNNILASGTWSALDPRDAGGVPVSSNSTPNDHTLTNECIQFTKSATNLSPQPDSPGDIIQYTLTFTVSDYFSFGSIVINDILGDGLRLIGTPQMAINDLGSTLPLANMNAANYTIDTSRFPPASGGTGVCGDGTTRLAFRVSDEMLTRGGDGILTGGRPGDTTGRIVFQARVQDLYACAAGDVSIDNNDTVTNSASIRAVIYNHATQIPLPGNPTTTDSDNANISIDGGALTKTMYARNGVLGASAQISPNDTVTYRLRLTFPGGANFENLRIQDYLPLPVFLTGEVTTFNPAVCGIPTAGTACFGTANTFTAVTPFITTDTTDNWVQFNYGTYDDPLNTPVEVDIVFTVTAQAYPLADGTFITNQAVSRRGTTSSGTVTNTVNLLTRYIQPVLTIRKGIVATNAVMATFIGSPVLPAGATITPPASACPRLGGASVTHSTYAAGGFNSDLTGVEAGDLVTFAIVIENTGRGHAFDVRFRDDLPPGLAIPVGGAGLNLCVRTGAGANISYNTLGSGLFDPAGGIELVDTGINGSIRSDRNPAGNYLNNGQNIAIITFDLVVTNPVTFGQTITNTAVLFNYSGANNGPDYSIIDQTDIANIIIGGPNPTKYLVTTSESATAAANVTLGEIARFRLTIRLTEGTFGAVSGIQFRDNLPTGLTFLDDGTARFAFLSSGAGITSTTLTCPNVTPYTAADASLANLPSTSVACAFPDNAVSRNATADDDAFTTGDDVFFSFGRLTNADSDLNAEFVVVEFNALVENSIAASSDIGDTLANNFRLRVNSLDVSTDSNTVTLTVNEPSLIIGKNLTTAPVDAGDTIVYTVTITAPAGVNISPAFDVTMTDVLPTTLAPVNVVSSTTSGVCGATVAVASGSITGQTVTGTVSCMNPDSTATFTITAVVRDTTPICASISNTASVVYTSLPGTNGTTPNSTGSTTPGSSGSPNGERNGSGGINDYSSVAPAVDTTLACPTPTIDKVTPTPTTYTLGDTITYNLLVTMPEGTVNDVSVTDDLPIGLSYVAGSAQIITTAAGSGGLLTTDYNGTVPAPTITAPGGSGVDVTLTFGSITTAGDNVAANDTFIVRLQAVVLGSITTNIDGAALTNSASLQYSPLGVPTTVTDPTPPVISIIEPRITTTKSVSPNSGVQSGDDLIYTVRFTNTGSSPAFDVATEDILAAGTDYTTASPTALTCTTNSGTIAGTLTDNGASLTFDGSPAGSWDIPVGGYIECAYTVRVTSNIFVDSTNTNTVDADWSSQDGSVPDERLYTDPSDGTTVDEAAATFTSPAPTFTKGDGGTTTVLIGSTVTYTLTVNSSRGTINDLTITDVLPIGMIYNNDAVMTGITSAAPTVSVPNDGTAPVTITWNLGDAIVSISPATIVFTATVANVPSNVGGTLLTNEASLQYSSGANVPQPPINASDSVTIAGEPTITTTKSVSPTSGVQAGDTLTYTVRFTNTGGSTAYDVTADDILAAGTDYTTASPTAITCTTNFGSGTLAGTITDNGTSLTFDGSPAGGWDIPSTDPDSYIECSYTLAATSALVLDGAHTNTIDADWSSLDGIDPKERLYTDPSDNLTIDTASVTFTSPAPTFTKSDGGAGALPSVPIGGTVNYVITISSPLGTLRNLLVTDTLPAGTAYGGSYTVSAGISPAPTFTQAGNVLTWTFGNAVVTQPITITYSLTVNNDPANQTGTQLTNAAVLTYNNDTATVTLNSTDTFTIADSVIATTKSVSPTSGVDASDTLTYTVRFTNTGGSTAYDVTADDILAAGTDYITTSPTAITCTTNFGSGTLAGTITDNGTSLTFDGSPAGGWDIPATDPDSYIECTYTVVAASSIVLDGTHTNTIDADWSSLNGSVPGERLYTDPGDNTTVDQATATFASPAPTFTKSDGGTGALPNVTIGDAITYTLTINSPLGTLRNLTVSDTLPTGIIYDDTYTVSPNISPAPTFTQTGAVLTWTFGDAVVSASPVTITFTARVDNIAGNQTGVVRTNNAQMTYNSDNGTQTLSAADSLTIVEPVLAITKNILVPPSPPSAGGVVTYQVVVSHAAGSIGTAYNVNIADLLPPGLRDIANVNVTAVGILPPSYEISNNSALLLPDANIGSSFDLPNGASVTITFEATIDNTATPGALLINWAGAMWSTQDGTPSIERDSGEVIIDGQDLLNSGALDDYEVNTTASFTVGAYGISKSLAGTSDVGTAGSNVTIGEVITYAITVALPEGSIPSLTVSDQLPAGLAFVTGSVTLDTTGFNGTVTSPIVLSTGGSGDDVTLNFSGITVVLDGNPANNSFIVRLQARVLNESANVAGAVLSNTSTVQAGAGPVSTSNAVDLTVVEPRLSIVKTFNPNVAGVGQTIQIQLVVSNTGSAAAYDVTLQDTLDTRLTAITEVTTPAGFTYSLASSTVTYSGGSVPANSSVTFVLSAQLISTVFANETIPNTATITQYDTLAGTDANQHTYPAISDDDMLTVLGPNLSITKTDSAVAYTPGTPTTYTIVVSNIGNSNINNALVSDDLMTGGRYNSVTWNCSTVLPTGGGVCDAPTSGTGDINTTVDLPIGAAVTFTITANINSAFSGNLVNTATINPPAGVTDPDPTNNTATDTNSNDPRADLSISKDDGLAAYTPGTSITYSLIVRNAGPSDALGATVIDALPAALLNAIWTCAPSGTALCTPSGTGSINDTVTIPTGTANFLTYTITATVDAAAFGDLINTATINAPSGFTDPDPANNTATDTNSNNPRIDLSITKDDGTLIYTPGTPLTYTIVVSNSGPSNVLDAPVADDLTTGGRFSAITWDCTTVAPTAGAVCDAPTSGTGDIATTVDVPAGGSVTFTVTATVDLAFTGNLANTVTVTVPASVTDTNTTNNIATDTDGQIAADLSITKTDNTFVYMAGDILTYVIVVRNAGPSDALGAAVTDTLPASLINVTWTCVPTGAATCTANGTGSINDNVNIPVNESLTYTITAEVDVTAVGALVNTTVVTAPAVYLEPNLANNTATDTDNMGFLDPPFGLKTVNQSGSAELTWGMFWINNSNDPNTILPMLVSDPIPSGVTYIDNSLACQASGQSVVIRCIYDNINNRIVIEAQVFADPSASDEATAQNEITVSYRTTINGGVTAVTNIASTFWDANGDNNALDDIAAGQVPIDITAVWGGSATSVTDLGSPAISKSVFPPFAGPGDTVAWTIVVTNPTSAPLLNLSVTDVILSQLTPLSVTATAGTATLNGQTMTFTIPSLAPAQSVTITIQTRINDNADSSPFIINRAVLNTGQSAEAVLALVEVLPTTGQTPLWRWLIIGGAALLLAAAWRWCTSLSRKRP